MIKTQFTVLIVVKLLTHMAAQHEQIPYAPVENICNTCSCHEEHNSLTLDCHNKGLKHILARWPDNFGKNHTGVEIHATFSKNDIEILQQLPATDGILYFSARRCKISKLQSKLFIDSPNIFRLDLSWNQLTEEALTPDIFQGPYNEQIYEPIKLKELDLSHNFIKDLDSKLFEHIKDLSILNLSNNLLSKFDKGATEAISSLKNLKILDISFNKITVLPDNIFQGSILNSLNLKQNNFTEFPSVTLKTVSNTLESLDVSYNPIEKIHTDSFDELTKLIFLNISNMSVLKTIEVGAFSPLKNLEELHCNNNYFLTQIHLPTDSKYLKLLDISNGNLNSIILDIDLLHNTKNGSLNYWPHLRKLILAENPWNCDCTLVKIFNQLKNVTVEKDDLLRCSSPIEITGTKLSDLNVDNVCEGSYKKNYLVLEHNETEYTPYYIRAKHVYYTIITIALVVLSGLLVGFGLSYGRRRLKSDVIRLKSSPIRYISVRNSV